MIRSSRATFAAVEKRDEQVPLRAFLVRPDVLAVAAGLFAVNYTLFVFMSWLPMYFTEALHMNMKSMSIFSSIPWAAAASGALVGGAASDFLFKRMKNAAAARKLAVVLPLFLVGISLVAFSFITYAGVSVAVAAFLLFCNSWAGQGIWSLEHELIPVKHLGAVGGYIHCLSMVSGVIGPAATGFIAGRFGGYSAAFLLAAAVSVAGVTLMAVLLRTGTRSDRDVVTRSAAA
jgi:ACS family hexuronate transporter-like MFS transporter